MALGGGACCTATIVLPAQVPPNATPVRRTLQPILTLSLFFYHPHRPVGGEFLLQRREPALRLRQRVLSWLARPAANNPEKSFAHTPRAPRLCFGSLFSCYAFCTCTCRAPPDWHVTLTGICGRGKRVQNHLCGRCPHRSRRRWGALLHRRRGRPFSANSSPCVNWALVLLPQPASAGLEPPASLLGRPHGVIAGGAPHSLL